MALHQIYQIVVASLILVRIFEEKHALKKDKKIIFLQPRAVSWCYHHIKLIGMFTIGLVKFIQVQVVDKNDNFPYFERGLYEAEVNEDENIGHTVLTLTANDKDECE